MSQSEPIKFEYGQIVITNGINEIANGNPEFTDFVRNSLSKHLLNDWGDLSPFDRNVNDDAVKNGGRLLSSYPFGQIKIWIITEADRSVTTILLPEEY